MSGVSGGYLLLARILFDSWLMERPPLYIKLWVWMLNSANWKDHGKLKRGQFLTSIREMREAMSYKVGYRKKVPTVDQIRSAYEAFTKASMITTTKTTRGMVVTVLNYERYQDFKSYEAHSESHDENPTKPTVTPHYKGKKGKERRDTDDSSESSGLRPNACSIEQWEKYLSYSQEFLEKQHERWGKLVQVSEPRVVAGAKALDNLIRVKQFPKELVHETLTWARDDDFWSLQLRSLGSLLKKGSNGESKFSNILAQRAKEESDAQRHAQ